MTASAVQITCPTPAEIAPVQAAPRAAAHGFSFHDFLSAINPLQYLPIVGTIYRAATGDVIPEGLRAAGSLVVSGLLGGPIGLISNIALTIGEKLTGIDPEKIVAAQFHPTPVVSAADTPVAAGLALSPRQLASYGVHSDVSGTLRLGDLQGADVLNEIELARIGKAASAYAANQTRPPAVMA